MKNRNFIITLITTIVICLLFGIKVYVERDIEEKHVTVGYIFVGDASTPYTYNFMKAVETISEKYGDTVTNIIKYNISEGTETEVLQELVDAKCDLIITGSYGYGLSVKEFAERNPNIQFVAATCDNANVEPKLSNFHTFMGSIYEGRYISGVVAGMKMKELIDKGVITEDEAVVGYVGAYPYAEVISGYTAFFLGVRSVVPTATMKVGYTNTWSNYTLEKELAEKFIDEGCVIISQHSDTTGPAVACENASSSGRVFHVGYNQSMTDIASSTSLISCRIDWEPYMIAAVDAMFENKPIEKRVDSNVYGTDAYAGFDKDWVEMLDLNKVIAAEGTEEAIERCIADFKRGNNNIFIGNYTGTNPYDENDVIDLTQGYKENDNSSAPTFHYVLDGVITVE